MKKITKFCIILITATVIIAMGMGTETAHADAPVVQCKTSNDCPTNEYCIDKKCQPPQACTNGKCPKDSGLICMDGKCIPLLDALTVRPGGTGKPAAVAGLPDITLEQGIASIIRTILGWSMLFTIIAIVVAAIFLLKSQGNDEDTKKAKDIILYLIIGVVIMAAAYGIVTGISSFDFFRGTPPPTTPPTT